MDNHQAALTQQQGVHPQSLRVLVRRIAAYLPITLARQILHTGLPTPGKPEWMTAATLFADMSGFTQMTETLAAEGPRGVEELNRALLITFTALINAIHGAGGSVAHFHGDAMLVYFVDEDARAAHRALGCAEFMQRLMTTSFATISSPRSDGVISTFPLSIKIGVGYGRCLQTIVGDPQTALEFVLGGDAVDQAVAAQQQADAGQVIASQSVLQQAGFAAVTSFQRLVDSVPVPTVRPQLYWDAFMPDRLQSLLDAATVFMPTAIHARLQHHTAQFVAEHRSVTTLFVQFEGLNFNQPDIGDQLQGYYQWASQIVARFNSYNGRINRVLTGDKGNQLHILFGAPSGPDAPEQAIRCALAMQAEKPPFITVQRIGLCTGRVFATAVGSQNRREYTVVGSVVNLSARLAQHCPPGAVLIDEATAVRVNRRFDLESRPPVPHKRSGVLDACHRVLQERVASDLLETRFARWQKPPWGREEELTTFTTAMVDTLVGQGQIVILSGQAGSGVRPFLAAGIRHWLAHKGRGAAGSCQPHLADVPYTPWQTIWRELFELRADMSAEAQNNHLHDLVAHYCPERLGDVPLLLESLQLPTFGTGWLHIPEQRQQRLQQLLTACLFALAEKQPIFLLLEDMQWADQASMSLIDHLAERVMAYPLFIVLTFRPVPPATLPLLNHPDCMRLHLADWPVERARRLVQRRLGTAELPPLLEEELGLNEKSNRGLVNPLFLDELLKMMLSQDVLVFEKNGAVNGRLRLDEAKLVQLAVPDTIYAFLLSRLDRLSVGARNMLQLASVIGSEFSLTLLRQLMKGMVQPMVQESLQELVEADMIYLLNRGPQAQYGFQHAQLHEAVYQSIPYARRQSVHLTIAEQLTHMYRENLKGVHALLAHHYGVAGQHQLGMRYALAAAEDARAAGAERNAAHWYRQVLGHLQALGLDDYWRTAVSVQSALSHVLYNTGELAQAAATAIAALDLCRQNDDDEQSALLCNQLAEIRLAQGRYAEAVKIAQALLTPQGSEPVKLRHLAKAHRVAGLAAAALASDDGLAQLRQAEQLLRQASLLDDLPLVLAEMGRVMSQQQDLAGALAVCEQAAAQARQLSDRTPLAVVQWALSQVRLRRGESRLALVAVQEAMEMMQGGALRVQVLLLMQRTAVYLYRGMLDKAAQDLQRVTALLEVMDDSLSLSQTYLLWAQLCMVRQQWEEALGWLEKARHSITAVQQAGGNALIEDVQLRLGLVRIALNTRQTAQAHVLIDKALRLAQTHKLLWWLPAIFYWQGMFYLQADNVALARRALHNGLEAVHRGGNPDELPLILLHHGLLLPVEDGRRGQFLEAAVAAAHHQARYCDALVCYEQAGGGLAQMADDRLRRIGEGCLDIVVKARG
jgi:predicted ATPase/class 3 adenylate cyclase